MSYKIVARKGNRTLNLSVEEKHQYYQSPESGAQTDGCSNPIQLHKLNSSGMGSDSMCPTADNFKILFSSNSIQINNGTQEVNRIGNKAQINKIDYFLNVWLKGNTMRGAMSHGQMIDTEFKFRYMIVKFDSPMTSTDLADWWANTRVFYSTYTGGLTTKPQKVSSVWTDMLSESNKYTGTFKILYDEKFTLGKNHTSTMKMVSLKPNKTLTFDANGHITNDNFANTYAILITPIWYQVDIDCVSWDVMQQTATGDSVEIARFNSQVKLTYYDN